jgi:hypothetical protein
MNLDFFENKYFFAIFAIFSTMYAFQIRPNLPDFMVKLFQSSLFRVFILFLVLVRGYKDVQFSILVAGAFVIIMDAVRQKVFKETFSAGEIIDTETHAVANRNINIAANELLEHYTNQALTTECDNNQRKLNEVALCQNLWFNEGGSNSTVFKNISNVYASLVPSVQKCIDNDPKSKNPFIFPPGSKGIRISSDDCATKYGQ